MKHNYVSSNELAKKLVISTLKEYDALIRKPKLSPSDLKTLRRLREAARIAKNLGC